MHPSETGMRMQSCPILIRAARPALWALGCLFLVPLTADGMQYQSWEAVPVLSSASSGRFGEMFRSAQTSGARMAMFGDSQETVPGAGGRFYVPSFNAEFYRRYGNVPESTVSFARSYSDDWLLRGSNAGIDQFITTGPDLLPSQWIGRFNDSPGETGLLAQLVTTAENTPHANTAGQREFNASNIGVEVIGRSRPGSAEIAWRVNLQSGDFMNYYGGTDLASGTTSLGLDQAGVGYHTQHLGVFSRGTHDAIQVIARGAGPAGADIAGVRFLNADNPAGISVQSFSAGGYRVADLVNNHSAAGDAFRAFGEFDAAILHFGANDAATRTALQFASDLQLAIDRLRTWAGNAELPVILLGDPDRDGLNPQQRMEFDMFAGAAASLSLSGINVLAVNSRRLAHDSGWFVGSPDFTDFVSDGVHYTVLGGQTLAALEVGALYSLAAIPEPSSGMAMLGTALFFCCFRPRRDRAGKQQS